MAEYRIVVCKSNWIWVGEYKVVILDDRHPYVHLTKAANIALWGTTRGLGQLADGPTAKTELKPCPTVKIPEASIIATYAINPTEKWLEFFDAQPEAFPETEYRIVIGFDAWRWIGKYNRENSDTIENAHYIQGGPFTELGISGLLSAGVELYPCPIVSVNASSVVATYEVSQTALNKLFSPLKLVE